jgi:DNA-binding LacI/PurR family transcriptional regulator
MWEAPTKRVTIVDVARAAGVSKTAVSFAFNYPERLGTATLDRVLRAAKDLAYTPYPAARALALRRMRNRADPPVTRRQS